MIMEIENSKDLQLNDSQMGAHIKPHEKLAHIEYDDLPDFNFIGNEASMKKIKRTEVSNIKFLKLKKQL